MENGRVCWSENGGSFFVAYYQDKPDEGERTYSELVQKVEAQTGLRVSTERISAIKFQHDGEVHIVQVGEASHREPGLVMGIFHEPFVRGMYYIASPNYGFRTPGAIAVGKNEILNVQYFAPL
ncbi:hypothetical protein [Paeniglutamicibacter sp. NPDC091659]|uniref:hypothetical protein n=1 Tax=Paeniglutamicibacter sp. NPDC091659 TaxID=3364389 RepID=UPI00382A2C2C